MEVIKANLPGMPTLDIMVPTHNKVDLTKRCVESIYFNTKSPFHLIICDDSTDKLTPLYFRELLGGGVGPLGKTNNLTFIHLPEGFKEGNQFFNTALRYTKSEYLAMVMNSVLVEPGWELFALSNMMPNNPTLGLIGFKCLFGGVSNKVGHIESAGIKMVKYTPTDIGRDEPGHRLTDVYECDAVQWAFALGRKKALVGNLEEGIFYGHRGWDDIDDSFAVKAKGWKIAYCGLGAGYHEPRATRGNNSPEAQEENKVNGQKFIKRWGLWDEFVKDYPSGQEVHSLAPEIAEQQQSMNTIAFQQSREN